VLLCTEPTSAGLLPPTVLPLSFNRGSYSVSCERVGCEHACQRPQQLRCRHTVCMDCPAIDKTDSVSTRIGSKLCGRQSCEKKAKGGPKVMSVDIGISDVTFIAVCIFCNREASLGNNACELPCGHVHHDSNVCDAAGDGSADVECPACVRLEEILAQEVSVKVADMLMKGVGDLGTGIDVDVDADKAVDDVVPDSGDNVMEEEDVGDNVTLPSAELYSKLLKQSAHLERGVKADKQAVLAVEDQERDQMRDVMVRAVLPAPLRISKPPSVVGKKQEQTLASDRLRRQLVSRYEWVHPLVERAEYCYEGCESRELSMVHCDGCGQWYHYSCVQVSHSDLADVKDWLCPPCQDVLKDAGLC
jgi:hypothetical protein